MHMTSIAPPTDRGAQLSRQVARLREKDMAGFRITPDDLANMEQVARVSSWTPESLRWTELGVYHRPGENRPFVAVTEGHSIVPREKLRFQYAAMGTLDRAMNWFDGSALRDELAGKVDAWQNAATEKRVYIGAFTTEAFGEGEPAFIQWEGQHATWPVDVLFPGDEIVRTPRSAFTSMSEALAWLYPGDDLSERARALAFERDFGMPERTVRNTLAIEAGRVEGKVGPWVPPMLVALRFMDRRAWEASRG